MSDGQEMFLRLIPTAHSLDIILKNTNFKDDLLDDNQQVTFKIDYTNENVMLSVSFKEPYYDFEVLLNKKDYPRERNLWLACSNIVIKLVLAQAVISDKATTRLLVLDFEESEKMRSVLM